MNKLWNASRFLLMNLGEGQERSAVPPFDQLALIHRWALHRVSAVSAEIGRR